MGHVKAFGKLKQAANFDRLALRLAYSGEHNLVSGIACASGFWKGQFDLFADKDCIEGGFNSR